MAWSYCRNIALIIATISIYPYSSNCFQFPGSRASIVPSFSRHARFEALCRKDRTIRGTILHSLTSSASDDPDDEVSAIESERRRLFENLAGIESETRRRSEQKQSRESDATKTLKKEFASFSEEANKAGFLKGATDPLRLLRQNDMDRLLRQARESASPNIQLPEVPTDAETAIAQAQQALEFKLASGCKRIRCDVLVPGLNPLIEDRFPYDESLMRAVAFKLAETLSPRTVTLLFDSAGAAAAARASLARAGPLPPTYRFGAISSTRVMRDAVGPDAKDVTPDVKPADATDAYLVVRPKNSRGDSVVLAVEQAVGKVPGATWLLVNPQLEDTVDAYAFGIGETDRRRQVVKQFDQCYYLRGLFVIRRPSMVPDERGCVLMRADGEPAAAAAGGRGTGLWMVFRLTPAGFEPMRAFEDRPSRTELGSLPW